jgi:carbon-monoxide dehydrogenase medium subunit
VNADEILCEIRVPLTGRAVAYVKTEQKASGFALAGVAVVADSKAGPARIGVTGVNVTPYRARASEQALGRNPDAAAIGAAAMHAAADTEALSDIHASAEFRRHLARVNTQRALSTALARA